MSLPSFFADILRVVTAVLMSLVSPAAHAQPAAVCHSGQSWDGPQQRTDLFLPVPTHIAPLQTGGMPTDLRRTLAGSASSLLKHGPGFSVALAGPEGELWSATPGLSPNAQLKAGSISKAFTAVIVFQLIEEGALSLNDPVANWLPDAPFASLTTLEDLLAHTSGLRIERRARLSGPYQDPANTIVGLTAENAVFCPGTNWFYSNIGYQMLGAIIARIDGRSYADSVEARIIAPLGLNDTAVARPGALLPRLAPGHGGGSPVAPTDYASAGAAGAIASTAPDLLRFWHAVMSAQIIDTASRDRMFETVTPMFGQTATLSGLGVMVYDIPDGPGLMFGHSGNITGYSNVVAYIPADEVFLAVMTTDHEIPAEAALWALLRDWREAA